MEVTQTEAIRLVHTMLAAEFGKNLVTDDGDEVVVLRDRVAEFSTAWLIPFNTRGYLDSGDPIQMLIPSVALVPKDPRRLPHYPPTGLPVATYVSMLDAGEAEWPLR